MYCQTYEPDSDQGACAGRRRDAQNLEGLRKRLRQTQEADPYRWQTSNDAIAHGWVRLHYLDVDLREWEPFERPEPVGREQLIWTREEVILVMDLYVRLKAHEGRTIPDQSSAEIVQLSELLKRLSAYPPERQNDKYRNPNGAHLKLTNLRAVQTADEHGMSSYSRRDAAIWREFVDNLPQLEAEAAAIRDRLQQGIIKPAAAEPSMRDVGMEQQHSETFMVNPSGKPRSAERAEHKLVLRYQEYMAAKGIAVVRKEYQPKGEVQPIYSDAWVEYRNALIEAKNSDSRNAIRLAIGQLYDYRRFHQAPIQLAVLLHNEPTGDRLDLLRSAGVEAIWEHGPGFRDSAGGAFT